MMSGVSVLSPFINHKWGTNPFFVSPKKADQNRLGKDLFIKTNFKNNEELRFSSDQEPSRRAAADFLRDLFSSAEGVASAPVSSSPSVISPFIQGADPAQVRLALGQLFPSNVPRELVSPQSHDFRMRLIEAIFRLNAQAMQRGPTRYELPSQSDIGRYFNYALTSVGEGFKSFSNLFERQGRRMFITLPLNRAQFLELQAQYSPLLPIRLLFPDPNPPVLPNPQNIALKMSLLGAIKSLNERYQPTDSTRYKLPSKQEISRYFNFDSTALLRIMQELSELLTLSANDVFLKLPLDGTQIDFLEQNYKPFQSLAISTLFPRSVPRRLEEPLSHTFSQQLLEAVLRLHQRALTSGPIIYVMPPHTEMADHFRANRGTVQDAAALVSGLFDTVSNRHFLSLPLSPEKQAYFTSVYSPSQPVSIERLFPASIPNTINNPHSYHFRMRLIEGIMALHRAALEKNRPLQYLLPTYQQMSDRFSGLSSASIDEALKSLSDYIQSKHNRNFIQLPFTPLQVRLIYKIYAPTRILSPSDLFPAEIPATLHEPRNFYFKLRMADAILRLHQLAVQNGPVRYQLPDSHALARHFNYNQSGIIQAMKFFHPLLENERGLYFLKLPLKADKLTELQRISFPTAPISVNGLFPPDVSRSLNNPQNLYFKLKLLDAIDRLNTAAAESGSIRYQLPQQTEMADWFNYHPNGVRQILQSLSRLIEEQDGLALVRLPLSASQLTFINHQRTQVREISLNELFPLDTTRPIEEPLLQNFIRTFANALLVVLSKTPDGGVIRYQLPSQKEISHYFNLDRNTVTRVFAALSEYFQKSGKHFLFSTDLKPGQVDQLRSLATPVQTLTVGQFMPGLSSIAIETPKKFFITRLFASAMLRLIQRTDPATPRSYALPRFVELAPYFDCTSVTVGEALKPLMEMVQRQGDQYVFSTNLSGAQADRLRQLAENR